jgi:hypothetical protein
LSTDKNLNYLILLMLRFFILIITRLLHES